MSSSESLDLESDGSLLLARARSRPGLRAAPPDAGPGTSQTLKAETHDSGFPLAHDTYNGLSSASDGRIYYVLSTEPFDVGARMFVFDPATGKIRDLGDLTEACGEKGRRRSSRARATSTSSSAEGKLYFATHVGYYTIIDGMEKMGIPPAGYRALSRRPPARLRHGDAASSRTWPSRPEREGILTMNMDTARGRIFGLTWPTGRFFRFDLARRDLKDFGPVCELGEDGKGPNYRTICRSIAVDPGDGSAYFTDSEGTIHRYRYATDAVEIVRGRRHEEGLLRPLRPDLARPHGLQLAAGRLGPVAAAWSTACTATPATSSGSIPRAERVEVLDRITSLPSQRSGMFDQFSYGYLGFTLGPDGRTLYYLTGGPVYVDGKRVAGKSKTAMGESKGIENLHLVTYDIPTGHYVDHGAIFFADGQRPAYVNSIAVGKDGTVYTLSRITEHGKTRTDLISIPASLIRDLIERPEPPRNDFHSNRALLTI